MEDYEYFALLEQMGLGDAVDETVRTAVPTWGEWRQDPEVIEVVKPDEGGPGGSDHSAFIELGIEALALMTHDKDTDAGSPHPSSFASLERTLLSESSEES